MKKAILLFIFQLCSLAMFAQINTDRVLTIGRNALYFEDYVLSIQYFNQVIKSKPWLAEPYFYRAVAKINLDDYKGAEEDCTLCLERNPFLVQAYYARGIARQSQEKFDSGGGGFCLLLPPYGAAPEAPANKKPPPRSGKAVALLHGQVTSSLRRRTARHGSGSR